uniref:Putative secreted protein n=1 Tax=Panstrongylus lignarius TaxID=156445 RepID=A0A224Y1S0_9HEMI
MVLGLLVAIFTSVAVRSQLINSAQSRPNLLTFSQYFFGKTFAILSLAFKTLLKDNRKFLRPFTNGIIVSLKSNFTKILCNSSKYSWFFALPSVLNM